MQTDPASSLVPARRLIAAAAFILLLALPLLHPEATHDPSAHCRLCAALGSPAIAPQPGGALMDVHPDGNAPRPADEPLRTSKLSPLQSLRAPPA